jgi:NhaP-type Na+/H+ or K+/H+ antiporter
MFPLAFIQIALGMLLFITPIPVEFNFDSELFMVALIAPLLFVEGVNVSRVHLRKYIKPVMIYFTIRNCLYRYCISWT